MYIILSYITADSRCHQKVVQRAKQIHVWNMFCLLLTIYLRWTRAVRLHTHLLNMPTSCIRRRHSFCKFVPFYQMQMNIPSTIDIFSPNIWWYRSWSHQEIQSCRAIQLQQINVACGEDLILKFKLLFSQTQ